MVTHRSLVLVLVLWSALGAAVAGPPPTSCTPLGFRGCDLDSDIVEFGQGALGGYGIEGRITSCQSCSPLGFPNPAGSFRLSANVEIEFGPYDRALCSSGDDTVPLTLTSRSFKPGFNSGGTGGNEPTYVPVDGNEVFTLIPTIELRTKCVDQDFLDYRIPRLSLTGLAGAKTEPKGSTVDTDLVLPESVRAEDESGLIARLALDEARIRQDLTLDHTDTYGISSELRLWPEALPFRLGPHDITYTETEVVFDTPGFLGGGPPAYTSALPAGADGNSGLEVSQIVSCIDPTNGTCSSLPIENLGYLHQPGWSPSQTRFDRDGLSLSLDLAAGREVTWELLYPTGVHMRLTGPARVVIEESRIADGYFGGGDIFVRGRGRTCDPQLGLFGHPRKHALRTGSSRPQVEAGGAILAGIENLNDNLGLTPQGEIVWAFNRAVDLGCGTAFAPAAVTDVPPNVAWYQSAVTTTRGRGIYAGLNYNRNRVCFSSIGDIRQNKLCKIDADCDAGQYCGDGGFSPLCGAFTSIPHWKPIVEGETLDFAIPISDPLQRGREMAFVLRGSGVTGVFDAGDGEFRVGDSDPARFDITFDRFGLSFKADDAEKGDTITQATIEAPWPALTELPLQEVEFCKCGGMDQGRPPQVALEANLAYWDQKYYPSAVRFMTETTDECDAVEQASQCGTRDSAAAVCVDAVVPLPRLAPQAVAAIEIHPDGRVPGMDIAHQTRLEFDRYDYGGVQQQPYQLDVVNASFQDWDSAPGPKGVCDVLGQSALSPGCPGGSGGAPFGYLDVRGKISLPVFGLTQLGLALQRPSKFTEAHTADAHEFSLPPGTGLSSFTARKSTSGATTDVLMKVDYFAPEAITDTGDGVDFDGRGRGTFLAYGWEGDVDLGIVEPAAAFILRPEGPTVPDADLGVASALRLWGAVEPAAKQQLKSILPAAHVDAWGGAYDTALAQLGYPGAAGFSLPEPAILQDLMRSSEAIATLGEHPDASMPIKADGPDPAATPPVDGSFVTGMIDLSPDFARIDAFELTGTQSTGGKFYSFDGSFIHVDRHVQDGEQPIISISRQETPDASRKMAIPGGRRIDFPSGGNKSSDSPITWDVDYDMPGFVFKSLTGTIDLTKGAFSGMVFDRLGAEMKFYADGDWYFTAGLQVSFSSGSMYGDGLFGNTKDLTPLRELDPSVASFLRGIDRFDGAYLRAGATVPFIDVGCLFNISVGAEVGGWKTSETYGGKLKGWIVGEAACIFSAIGVGQLIGGVQNDTFKWRGDAWAGAGVGFCDEEDWHEPEDVLDDNFCSACVGEVSIFGSCGPDFELDWSGPSIECAL